MQIKMLYVVEPGYSEHRAVEKDAYIHRNNKVLWLSAGGLEVFLAPPNSEAIRTQFLRPIDCPASSVYEINSHEINCHQINSHEVNFSRDQLSRDQFATKSTPF